MTDSFDRRAFLGAAAAAPLLTWPARDGLPKRPRHLVVLELDLDDLARVAPLLAMIEAGEHELRFKIYIAGAPVPLSDILPMLENMGLKVIGETPYSVNLPDQDGNFWIYDFETVTDDGAAVDLGRVKEAFHDAFARVWSSNMENDGFNKLVIGAGLLRLGYVLPRLSNVGAQQEETKKEQPT